MPDPAVALSVRTVPGHRYSACVTDRELLAEVDLKVRSYVLPVLPDLPDLPRCL